MNVIGLASNRPPERFYRGGAKITTFRSEPPAAEREPEDWVASTTALFGEQSLGVTMLPDGRPLPVAIADDPESWLGPDHLDRFGADTRLLVKLLDAGQRLPVHAHPSGSFAAEHLGRAHGKAEAWYILEGGTVHLGLRDGVGPAQLGDLVNDQHTDRLLGLLHEVEVSPGDVVYVPPGVLHAIGEGVFLVEVQEPEDLSILLEWRGFALDGAREGHLGLGFGRALEAVETRARSRAEIGALVRPAGFGPSVLPTEADEFFVIEHLSLAGSVVVAPGFAVVVVVSGSARLTPAAGGEKGLAAGSTTLVPYAAGPVKLSGDADVLICRPPAPVSRGGRDS